jgi:SWI/SNF-related matrix-associated actin-dependent regulator of chromatin subfamily A3
MSGRHCTGLSSITIYHSQGREGNPKVLADSDIVLSTYHVIAAESMDKTSPLWQINWFRVVLDEGNIFSSISMSIN